jgi:hypothetical protein
MLEDTTAEDCSECTETLSSKVGFLEELNLAGDSNGWNAMASLVVPRHDSPSPWRPAWWCWMFVDDVLSAGVVLNASLKRASATSRTMCVTVLDVTRFGIEIREAIALSGSLILSFRLSR